MKNIYSTLGLWPNLSIGRQLFLVIVLSSLCLSSINSYAQTNWTGATGTDWNTAENWSAGVPDTDDDVIILNTINKPVIGVTIAALANSVEVQSGATLTIESSGSLTVSGAKNISDFTTCFSNNGTVQNNGQLILSNVSTMGYYGLWNKATFNNNIGAEIKIDRTLNTGLYNSEGGTFTNAAKITIGANEPVGYIGLLNGAIFSNTTGAEININRTTFAAFANSNSNGTFTNTAKITIGAMASVGVYGFVNQTTFNNNMGAEIIINRSTIAGLYNTVGGNFTNAAKLTIGAIAFVGDYGLWNSGIFNNYIGAEIKIDRSTTRGLYNENGTFTNIAKIIIGATASVGSMGIRNEAGFDNNGCEALINIVSNSIVSNMSSGTFTNSGNIIENATGYSSISSNTGLVQNLNGGDILILSGKAAIVTEGVIWTGCTDTAWATASNWSMGRIPLAVDNTVIPVFAVNQPTITLATVANSVEVQSGATLTIAATGSLTINGSKIISSVGTAFYNNGTVQNYGKLVLGNTAAVGHRSLWNFATFNNNPGAEINIDRSIYFGISNNGGVFTNSAKITIGAMASVGDYGLLNRATFNNNMGAEIKIDRSTDAALYNNVGGVFTNAAKIIIGANAAVGYLGLVNSDTFNNNSGAEVSIDRTTETGLYNNGRFSNAAKITIGAKASVGLDGLLNYDTFNNKACAVLNLFYRLNNYYSFTNEGLFTVNTTKLHSNNALTNNGIIEYLQGNAIPNVINNDVIIVPISTCNTVIPALQIGNANSFTIATNWYKDSTLNTIAGTYTPNTFTVTNLDAGNIYPLYFTVTDPINMCNRRVSITATVYPTPPIPTITLSGSTSFCLGDSVILTSSAVSGNQWYLNGNPIAGATRKSFITSTSGDYSTIVTLLRCTSTPSLATPVMFNPVPDNIILTEPINGGTVLKVGGEITATNQVSGAAVVYKGAKSITLLPDFIATSNTFTAFIGGCESSSTTGSDIKDPPLK